LTDREFLLALEQVGIKLGLDAMRTLLDALGRPDRAYPSLIVAGTNGKGSVTALIERALRAAGCRTGRYTSPHLVHLEERFAVDGVPVEPAAVDALAARVRTLTFDWPHPPSFFEATTAIALEAFRREAVDVAILEVGLGGRLDATNVVTPVAGVITAIGLDHQEYLGTTRRAIAAEKAGIVKHAMPVVLAENPPDVVAVVEETARRLAAPLVRAGDGVHVRARMVEGITHLALETPVRAYDEVPLSLRGRHQVPNAVAAVRLLETLDALGLFAVPAEAILTALTDTRWPGRLDLRRLGADEILIDGAHNPAGAAALSAYVEEAYGRRLPFVVGIMRDKAIADVLASLAPAASSFTFTSVDHPRAEPADRLAAAARSAGIAVPIAVAATPARAVAAARASGSPVVVAGSLYLAGAVLAGVA
jgi:dihydrofolate synthase/folylpolyglutamate synthase